MGVLDHFADFFKRRKVPIRAWFRDDVGRWAFRVDVDGQPFICAARKSAPSDDSTSLMRRVAGYAQTRDALIAIMLPDDRVFVFDPVAVLAHGTADEVYDQDRVDRDERWIKVPLSIGCRFQDWYDGVDAPAAYEDVAAY